jgi:hypothetical protein
VLKKTFTYKNLDDVEVTEDWYFSLNVSEIAELSFAYGGDASKFLQNIIDTQEKSKIFAAFKDIIGRAVGIRSDDNRSFLKGPEITQRFFGTDAFSSLLLEMITDANAGANFINAIIPSDLAQKAAKLQASDKQMGQQILEERLPENIFPEKEFQEALSPDNFSWEEMLNMTERDLHLLGEGQMYDKPGTIKPVEEYTREQLLGMNDRMFAKVAGDPKSWSKELLVIAMKRRVRKN